MFRFFFLLVIAFSSMQIICISSETGQIVIDLAKTDEEILNIEELQFDEISSVSILIKNFLPAMKYSVKIGKKTIYMQPIKLKINNNAKGCEELFEAEKFNLFYEVDERIIRIIKKKFKKSVIEYCEDKKERQLYNDSLTSMTEIELFSDGIEIGELDELKVSVIREKSRLDPQKHEWNILYRFNRKEEVVSDDDMEYFSENRWTLSYGFAFPILFSTDEEYYVKQSDSIPGMYDIKMKRDNQYIKFIPSIFLHWSPSTIEPIEWMYSVTGGIGFDMENPIIFAGGSVTYHNNLNINYGIVVHKVSRLNGKYSSSEVLDVILDYNQLHEEFYRINPFVGISFRFSDSKE